MIEEFNIDIVYVIDASNGGAISKNIKNQIAAFAEKLDEVRNKCNYIFDCRMREKLLFFGDFATDGDKAILETEFFDSATQKAELLARLDDKSFGMKKSTGARNGMEALFAAMNSDWFKIDWSEGIYGRHVIVFVSDEYPLFLQERRGAPAYCGDDFPGDYAELLNVWNDAGSPESIVPLSEFRRLILCIPEGYDEYKHSWEEVMSWSYVVTTVIEKCGHGKDADLLNEGLLLEIIRDNWETLYQHTKPAVVAVKADAPQNAPAAKADAPAPAIEKKQPDKKEPSELENSYYALDVALVIDTADSMSACIEKLKSQASKIGYTIVKMFESAGKPVKSLRMRVVEFSDYATKGDDAIVHADFFDMPEEQLKLEQTLGEIECVRRSAEMAGNGLEALYAAMLSDWTPLENGQKGRHIIILLTDAPPFMPGERAEFMGFWAEEFPSTSEDMRNEWENPEVVKTLSKKNKRLVMFAPQGDDGHGHSWDGVAAWENTAHCAVLPNNGLKEIDIIEILQQIEEEMLRW